MSPKHEVYYKIADFNYVVGSPKETYEFYNAFERCFNNEDLILHKRRDK